MLERPPQLDEVARVAQRRAGGLLDALLLVEPRAQRRLELGPEPAEAAERLQVARGEGVAERLVGQDRGPDREVGERQRSLLAECDRRLERAAGRGEGRRER